MSSPTVLEFRLLIVDDNEAIHNDLKKILLARADADLAADEAILFGQAHGHEARFTIDSAFQGQEGLAFVESAATSRRPYAVAFVDMRMPPGWDGVQTIEHLWKVDPDLQVIMCTAYSDYTWRDIEQRLGLSPNLLILKKPFDSIEVIQLAHALAIKWSLTQQARIRMVELNVLVEERTAKLSTAVREMECAKEAAETAALQDPLTKLPNRRLFQDRLTLSLQRAERHPDYLCALLYLDLDDFKVINDSLGHQAGDELLVEVANRLQASLRCTDAVTRFPVSEGLVVRLGGDEFAILLEGIRDVSDALRVADRISEKFNVAFHIRGKDLSVSASIGITSSNQYPTAESMLRDADTAMYRAKVAGRGKRAVFDDAMHCRAVERLQLESELRRALEQNEFVVHYQPIVSLSTGRVVGFEALLRWQSPHRGLVAPSVFIPVAEETGLIIPIGVWVLRKACSQVRKWLPRYDGEPPVTMSVNLSAKQFVQPDLASTVAAVLLETGIEGSNLRLELTESVAMADPAHTCRILEELQALGVRLSIDDFGTGYSSLEQLHRLSADMLKVDRYFVSSMVGNERNQKIVNTVINLAHNLGIHVVAEGAETDEELDMLRRMSCDCVQGYVFSRPLAAEELELWMAAQCLSVMPNAIDKRRTCKASIA
jgi:diguanylate cyclase